MTGLFTTICLRYPGENSLGGENGEDSCDGEGSDRSSCMLREQDRFLPIANVARIMKKTIPRTGKVPPSLKLHFSKVMHSILIFLHSFFRLPKMHVNVCRSVFLSSLVSSQVKLVNVATKRKGKL